jgi:outer membrane protein assembly factor BamB/TolA-binding protein
MAKTADEFLNDLAERDLVPAEIVASLRRQVASSAKPVAAATLAKLLTDKGQLTAAQAQRILGGAAAPAGQPAPRPAKAVAKSPAPMPADDLAGLAPLDDGGLMPLDDLTPLDGDGLAPLDDLTPLDNVPPLAPKPAAPVAPAKPPPQAKPKPAAAKATAPPPSKPAGATTPAGLAPLAELSSTDGLAPLDDLTQPAAPVATGSVDLLSDAGLAGPLAAAPAAPTAAPQASQPAKKKSSLGLVLGLLAIVLLIGGGAAAFMFIPRGTGDAEFDLAAADYEAKSYDAAIAKFDAVLAKYPQSPRASLARVQRGAAQVLAARAQSPRNWQPVLAAAKESLPPIGGEAELSQVHAELAPLLSEMAVALATSAASGQSDVSASVAREALALADDGRFVPGSLRDWQKLQGAADNLARIDYNVAAATAREGAAAAIQKAIDAGDVAAALAERDKLRRENPDLLNDAKLITLGKSLATAAVAKIQPTEYAVKGEATEPRGAVVGQLALRISPRATEPTASSGGPTKVFVNEGAAWAVTSGGTLQWHRPLGSGPAALPIQLDGGYLLVDAYRNELLSVTTNDGALRWRHSLPGPAAGPPVILGPRVFITTKAGLVLAIDGATGDGIAQVQLPQAVSVGPAAAGEFLVQVADDALVYVLATADLKGVSAAYLGHEPGSVAQPPAAIGKLVVVPTTRWPAATVLRPILANAQGQLEETTPTTEVTGVLTEPLVVEQGKLIVTTDQGRATTFESAPDPAEGLKQVSAADVQPDAAAAPALSPAGVVAGPSADTLTAISETGATTEIKLAELTGLVVRDAVPAAQDPPSDFRIAAVLPLPGGGALLVPSGQPAELRVLDAGAPSARSIPLPGTLAALPLVWNGGIAAACSSGSIVWLDPAAGTLKADPLQINLLPGERLATCRLAAGGKDGQELFVAHSGGTILRVGLATDPQPQLVELAAAKIEATITGMGASDTAVGVLDRRGQWHTFTLPDLAAGPAASLAGRSVLVGPTRLGNTLLVATDSDELIALNEPLQAAWNVPLAHGPLAGVPVADGSGALMATQSGWVYRIALDTGKEAAAVNLSQTLAGSPLVVGQFALVPAADGTLLKVSLAALEAPQP